MILVSDLQLALKKIPQELSNFEYFYITSERRWQKTEEAFPYSSDNANLLFHKKGDGLRSSNVSEIRKFVAKFKESEGRALTTQEQSELGALYLTVRDSSTRDKRDEYTTQFFDVLREKDPDLFKTFDTKPGSLGISKDQWRDCNSYSVTNSVR